MGVVTSLFVRKMVAAAAENPAVDAGALLSSVGLDPAAGADPGVMVADTAYYDLLERIAADIDVTDLPLRTGASMECDNYGALGLAFKAAPTLRGSYGRVARFARLWTSVVEYEMRRVDGATFFILNRAGARRLGLRLSNEATLASAVSIARQVSPVPFAPLQVLVKHAAPDSLAAHQAYFGCDVRFGAERDALLISDAALDRPNILGDEGITRFLDGHLTQALDALRPEISIEDQARGAIANALSEGPPRMETIARRLGLSVRSLHRRLAEHGLTFQTLAEGTRRELAEGLLRDERYSLSEIAFLTGFSEQSAFTRAFKRWVGLTPARYRQTGGAHTR